MCTMFSKRQLQLFLEEISDNAMFIKFQFASPEKFALQLKCKVNNDETKDVYDRYAAEWIKKFAKFTATTWIVRSCFAKLKRLLFRKVFVCHRSAFNKKRTEKSYARDRGCQAKIDFKTKLTNRNTIKNDPDLKEGLNMTITIDFWHSHSLRTEEALTMLKSTQETDEIFCGYFENGYSAVTAKLYHELTVVNDYGVQPQYLMNANINPKIYHVNYLYRKTRKPGETKAFDDIMAPKKATMEAAGGVLNYDNPSVVSVITPTMRRVIFAMNLEHILVDSIVIPHGPVVTFLYAISKAGALPIACILHEEESGANYRDAFLAIKLILESIIGGPFEPKLLNIKDTKEMHDATTSIFPTCIVLSSKWSVCSNVWRWICDDENKIWGDARYGLMESFSEMVRCNSLEVPESYYKLFKEDEDDSPAALKDFVEELWERRVQWLNAEDQVSLNVVEASMRVMNEFVHQKCKSFNTHMMVDVLTNIVDSQTRRILHAHAKSLNVASTYTKFLDKSKEVLDLDSSLKRLDKTEFRIENKSKYKRYIMFRTDHWCCDCSDGKKGRFCEHLCAAINVLDTDLMKTTELTDEEKCLFTDIAGPELENRNLKYEIVEEEEEEEEKDMDIDDIEEIQDDASGHFDNTDGCLLASAKSKADDGFYYLDVKTENCEGNDPLNETENSFEKRSEEISSSPQNVMNVLHNVPSTSKVNLKSQYEDAMKALNSEFRRLNKYFKSNPNKSNMETMVRLASELAKIRPIERVDLDNMHIQLNSKDENQS